MNIMSIEEREQQVNAALEKTICKRCEKTFGKAEAQFEYPKHLDYTTIVTIKCKCGYTASGVVSGFDKVFKGRK